MEKIWARMWSFFYSRRLLCPSPHWHDTVVFGVLRIISNFIDFLAEKLRNNDEKSSLIWPISWWDGSDVVVVLSWALPVVISFFSVVSGFWCRRWKNNKKKTQFFMRQENWKTFLKRKNFHRQQRTFDDGKIFIFLHFFKFLSVFVAFFPHITSPPTLTLVYSFSSLFYSRQKKKLFHFHKVHGDMAEWASTNIISCWVT